MNTDEKKELRKIVLKERKKLNKDAVNSLSDKIISYLIKMKEFKQSETIMVYLSFKQEVDTFNLIDKMRGLGKKVVITYTDKKENVLIPCRLIDLEDSLEKNPFGYLEPKEDSIEKVNPSEIDLIITPGLAFDKKGNRVGYGGGYYDKLLKSAPQATKIAVSYDFQIFSEVPSEKFDIPVDYIVTPTRIIVCER
ncbi:5-formyltetrahydrofolate cyclo-ligase [Senegalia massiliensis]|uniref:5-formyltetrahydrofolate cyclo-ligase n=1 Tax=Senegalia massiliensis TaxID=1720316 RepID=A0A845QW86_9CLOT|nr:5-formyltetrahydrofolate cyclo-ligase [Senegalia massiliensis]NBI06254.1 5-formyltetrahydrofolate cyclo-ligase [Senegalia massiliensis]